MKVALAHDWLNTRLGGAEHVLEILAELFPDAPIYTLIYNEQTAGKVFPKDRVITSKLQSKPRWLKKRSKYLLPLIPAAVEGLDFRGYDLVISSSGAWMKNILTPTNTKHLCYCHSPMRFVWDYWPEYLDEQNVGPIRSLAIRQITSYLRVWDREGVARVDQFLANSATTAERIKKFYDRDSSVIYPPVNLEDLKPTGNKGDFLLTAGALTPYKKWDLAIQAANQLGKRLVVVGEGPDRSRLEGLAGPTVEIRGYVTRKELIELYASAQALLFPQEEDFGIAAVEALGSGTPVIAYSKGGATEIVDSSSGIFFDEQTPDSLGKAIQKLDNNSFSQKALTSRASNFDTSTFEKKILTEVGKLA
jgi:glycosyltransferase involved in cell wall biosynthesis